jgi:hypothetical protein
VLYGFEVVHPRPLALGFLVTSSSETRCSGAKASSKYSMHPKAFAILSSDAKETSPVLSNLLMDASVTPDFSANVFLDRF